MLLHALRVALIGRIWLLAMAIPEFSPRHGVTREALVARLLRLDVPAALVILGEVVPGGGRSCGGGRFCRAEGGSGLGELPARSTRRYSGRWGRCFRCSGKSARR